MIIMFTGKTGSGKTWQMVHMAFKEWKYGRDVYSNTLLFYEKFKKKKRKRPYGNIYYFEDINELVEVRSGIILIDEGQVLFNARNWEALPFEFQYKLQQHRKHKLDLYCTAQNMGTVDIAYRRLVQNWYHCNDKFALFGKRNPSLISWHTMETKDIDFLYNQVDDLQVPSLKSKLFVIHRWKRKLYDTLYDIGFDRLKTLWITYKNYETDKKERIVYIIGKQTQLKDALRSLSSMTSALGLKMSKVMKKT